MGTGKTMWELPARIIRSTFENRRTAVHTGHSLSKDWAGGIVSILWLLANQPSKVINSAPTSRQVIHIMFSEIKKQYTALMARSPWAFDQRAMKTSMLDLGPDWYALGFTTKESKGDSVEGLLGKFQGFKSPNMLVVITEAQSVDDSIFDAMEGILSSGNARVLELGNPIAPAGRFWEHCTQKRFGYNVIQGSCMDSPNYKARREVIPGVVSYDWVEEKRRIWGEDHPYWFGRVLGEFPQSGADCIIPIAWIVRAVNRELDPIEGDKLKVSGTDVSKGGSDETVHAVLTGRTLTRLDAFHDVDINETVGWAKSLMREEQVLLNACDEGGLAGVAGFLEEENFECLRVQFGGKAESEDFDNVGAEIWWHLREAFQNNQISIPDDPILIGQLAKRKYEYTSIGKRRIKLESKRKSGDESPDRGDALALAWLARRHALGGKDAVRAFANQSADLDMGGSPREERDAGTRSLARDEGDGVFETDSSRLDF